MKKRNCVYIPTLLLVILLSFAACQQNTTMKKAINSNQAPKPIGPYSQAIEANGFIFVSGQIAIDPESGNMFNGTDVKAETRVVMKNLKSIILEAGCNMSDVVKCSIFLRDMNDFGDVNSVYGEYFPDVAPARETVAVSGLPKNARVEISAVVLKK